MSESKPYCPVCGSEDISIERTPDGSSHCNKCGNSWPHKKIEASVQARPYVPVAIDENGYPVFDDDEQLRKAASVWAKMEAVPKHFQEKPTQLRAALVFLKQARKSIAFLRLMGFIHGSLTVFAEGVPALAQEDPLFGEVEEFWIEEDGKRIDEQNPKGKVFAAVFKIKKKGAEKWSTYMFTMDDAKEAGLLDRNANYKKYPKDMLMHKARTRGYKAHHPGALHGLDVHEDRADIQEKDVTPGVKALKAYGEESNQKVDQEPEYHEE